VMVLQATMRATSNAAAHSTWKGCQCDKVEDNYWFSDLIWFWWVGGLNVHCKVIEEYECRSNRCSCRSILQRVRATIPLHMTGWIQSKFKQTYRHHQWSTNDKKTKTRHKRAGQRWLIAPVHSLYRSSCIVAFNFAAGTPGDAPDAALGASKARVQELRGGGHAVTNKHTHKQTVHSIRHRSEHPSIANNKPTNKKTNMKTPFVAWWI
jgi:hypothetical protein